MKLFFSNNLVIGLFFLTLFSCQSKSTLEDVLQYSGENRSELEKVIDHYSQKEGDSLQLKAALFLIENMPGHYSLTNSMMERLDENIDSLYPDMSNIVKRVVYNIPIRKGSAAEEWKIVEDIQTIKSDYLIKHIDNAMAMWNKCPWLRLFTFNDFCEYVLPYRIAKESILESDSTLYSWKTVKEVFDTYNYVPKTMQELKTVQRDLLGHTDDAYFLKLQMPAWSDKAYNFDCLDRCYYEMGRLRSVGIPATIDFVPGWPYRNGQHYWRVLVEPYYWNSNHSDALISETGKVYRMTYSRNVVPEQDGEEFIPSLFRTSFYKDVTQDYVKVSDVEVDINKFANTASRYAYLSIFNDLEWKPIAWAEVKGGEAKFRNMGRNVVYLPIGYEDKETKHLGYPFLLDIHGNINEFIPNEEKRITLRFTRKFPVNDSKIIWSEEIKGSHIEASNYPDFTKADTVYIITQTNTDLNYQTLALEKPATYRYWRLFKNNQILRIGDWQFFDEHSERIRGEVMPPKEDDITAKNAFDEKILSFTLSHTWVGIDFGKPVTIQQMKLVTRTDDNAITPGHYYELYYFTKEGWTLVEGKKAEGKTLEFKSVAADALYWLRDLTAGKEERIFAAKNGKIEYW